VQQTQAYCPQCKQPRLFARANAPVPLGLNLLLSLLTCGSWIPVWVLWIVWASYFGDAAYRCQACGQALEDLLESKRAAQDAAVWAAAHSLPAEPLRVPPSLRKEQAAWNGVLDEVSKRARPPRPPQNSSP